jgi:hypothetical protein
MGGYVAHVAELRRVQKSSFKNLKGRYHLEGRMLIRREYLKESQAG